MANLNKIQLIGRLTRDPELKTFSGDGKVAVFGFAVNNRRKDKDGEWVDEPVFIDCDAFGKTAELIDEYLSKGSQAYLEGRLKLDQWKDKTSGDNRSKLKVVVENVQFLDSKKDGGKKKQQQEEEPAYVAPEKLRDLPF